MSAGRRVYSRVDGTLHLAEGDYGFDERLKHWVIRPPGCHAGGIPHHQVEEHPDGTITVTPSIVLMESDLSGETTKWHGYLTKGEWIQL